MIIFFLAPRNLADYSLSSMMCMLKAKDVMIYCSAHSFYPIAENNNFFFTNFFN